MSLISVFFAAKEALARRRQQRWAYAEMASLDDRSLADIGLHRSQIPAVIEGYHEAVQLDAAPNRSTQAARRRDGGLNATQGWLRGF
jgi:uncharacterized protein YjiS (DUF1127 family)